MRQRPVRSQLYLPVTRFGVLDSDWKFVFIVTFVSYAGPFLLDLRLFRVPVEMWASLLGLGLSVAFFNYVRIGRKPFWLHHQVTALFKPSRLRRRLPADPRSKQWCLKEN
jgi:hypothetical protein